MNRPNPFRSQIVLASRYSFTLATTLIVLALALLSAAHSALALPL